MDARRFTRTMSIIAGVGFALLGAAAGASIQPLERSATDDPRAAHETIVSKADALRELREIHPGLAVREVNGRTQIFGKRFGGGDSPEDSARRFIAQWASALGTTPEQIQLGASHLEPGVTSVPAMYDPDTGSFRFTIVYAQQQLDGAAVFGRRATFVVRNEPGYPLVMVKSDVRATPAIDMSSARRRALPGAACEQIVAATYGPGADALHAREIVWVSEGEAALAHEWFVGVDIADERRVVTDAATGQVLSEEQLVCFGGVPGNPSGHYLGLATDDVATAECEDESLQPIQFARIRHGEHITFTDETGFYQLPGGGPGVILAELVGRWFTVIHGPAPPDPLEVPLAQSSQIVLNEDNVDQVVRAHVNAYVQANRGRLFAQSVHPVFPGLQTSPFGLFPNIGSSPCPGVAWYAPLVSAIFLCGGVGGFPNMAWSSVILHEYAHHLVHHAGSGQGQYGEGIADAFQSLILRTPQVAVGALGDCDEALHDPSEDVWTYPCTAAPHFCGQVLSGAIWEIRELIAASRPQDYEQIIANLTLNSILLHSSARVDPEIVLDFLILDDDDGDLSNGTPNEDAILAGFATRNLSANQDVIWEDNFESDTGWTFTVVNNASGAWERGVPVADPDWPAAPMRDGDGSGQCLLTENQPGNSDVDVGAVRALSPPIALPTGRISVDYQYFINMEDEQFEDGLEVLLSLNGPEGPWQRVFHHTVNGGDNWTFNHVDWLTHPSLRITFPTTMHLRVEARDLDNTSLVEGAFDGVRVAWKPEFCPADCAPVTGDGVIDIADITAVLNAFGGAAPVCDVSPVHPDGTYGDGRVTISDIIAVIQAFGSCN